MVRHVSEGQERSQVLYVEKAWEGNGAEGTGAPSQGEGIRAMIVGGRGAIVPGSLG